MSTPVTMIGLGPMGQAMVRAYLAAGASSTPSRPAHPVSAGATRRWGA